MRAGFRRLSRREESPEGRSLALRERERSERTRRAVEPGSASRSPARERVPSKRKRRGEEPRAAGARAREGSGTRSRPFGRAASRWRSQIPSKRKRRYWWS